MDVLLFFIFFYRRNLVNWCIPVIEFCCQTCADWVWHAGYHHQHFLWDLSWPGLGTNLIVIYVFIENKIVLWIFFFSVCFCFSVSLKFKRVSVRVEKQGQYSSSLLFYDTSCLLSLFPFMSFCCAFQLQESLCLELWDRESVIDGPIRNLLFSLRENFPYQTLSFVRLLAALCKGAWPAECVWDWTPKPLWILFCEYLPLCYVRSRTEDLVISAKVVLQYVMHLHKLFNGFLIVIWFLFCCCCCCTQVWFSVQDGEDYIFLSASWKLYDAWARWHRANYCRPSGSWCPWPVHTSWHLWAYSEGGWWTSQSRPLGGMNTLLFSSLHDSSSLSCLSAVGCACLLGAAVKQSERDICLLGFFKVPASCGYCHCKNSFTEKDSCHC